MENESLKTLKEIKSLMEKSTRFISLSGISGIAAGIVALIGCFILFLNYSEFIFAIPSYYKEIPENDNRFNSFLLFIWVDAILILFFAIGSAIFFTTLRAKKNKQAIWDHTVKNLLINMFIPLAPGGIFCLILFFQHQFYLIPAVSILFYGLALINAGKYTLNEIKYLGLSEIIVGLFASIFWEYGFIFWAFGFGIMHIIYGSIMYFKYEKA